MSVFLSFEMYRRARRAHGDELRAKGRDHLGECLVWVVPEAYYRCIGVPPAYKPIDV
jgi:hypothetical protein